MADNGIDVKPKARGMSARAGRRKAALNVALPTEATNHNSLDADEGNNSDLNIRVKDRSSDEVGHTKKTLIGGLLKETPMKGAAETLKRPLTGIFRRPGSRAGSRKQQETEESANNSNHSQIMTAPVTGFNSYTPMARDSVVTSPPRLEYDAIARAPSMAATKLHEMLQVDQWAIKHPQLAKLDDIDMSVLSRLLCSEDETEDEAVPWTWDYLFASVSTEMREEWANENEEP